MATWVLLAPYIVPIVAILATFGTPVAIIYVVKYFKALEKGLVGPRAGLALPEVADLQERLLRLERERLRLESRVQQLEILSAAPALPPARADGAAALPESRVRALPEAAETGAGRRQ